MLRALTTGARSAACLSRGPSARSSNLYHKNVASFATRSVAWKEDTSSATTTTTTIDSVPPPTTTGSAAQRSPRRRHNAWSKEEDEKLRELGAQVGKTLSWQDVAEAMQAPLSSIYFRHSKLIDPRMQQLENDPAKMRELEHLVAHQLHWHEIGQIMGNLPAIVVENAYKKRHKPMPPISSSKLTQATMDPRYQLFPRRSRNSNKSKNVGSSGSSSSSSSNNKQDSNKVEEGTAVVEYLGMPIQQWPEYDWEAIATEVFANRYEPEVLRQNYFRSRVSSLRFSPRNNQALRAAVMRQLKANHDENKIDWEVVHQDLYQHYSPAVCRRAWARQQEISWVAFPWKEDEMIEYWQQYIRHGKNWDAIARHLDNRTSEDCRRDFQKLAKRAEELGDAFKRKVVEGLSSGSSAGDGSGSPVKFPVFFFSATSWTPELDAQLVKLHQEAQAEMEHGHTKSIWESVAARLDAGASVLQCILRYKRLEKESRTKAKSALELGNDDNDEDEEVAKVTKSRRTILHLTAEEKDKLTRLVQEINPTRRSGWEAVHRQMSGRPLTSLKVLWGELQREMILDNPEGRAALERAVLTHGDGMWHAVGDDLTQWLYRDRPPQERPSERDGAARVRIKMARMLWNRLHPDSKQSPIWTPQQVEDLKRAVRRVVRERSKKEGRKDNSPTIEDWMEIGRRIESKNSLQCLTMWNKLQASPGAVEEQMVAQPVFQHLWLHGRLPTTEQDKEQWERDNPGLPLKVPTFFEQALSQKPDPNNGWSPMWDRLLDMTAERYGATFPNYHRLAEILGTTEHDVKRARHRMVRRRHRLSRRAVEDDD